MIRAALVLMLLASAPAHADAWCNGILRSNKLRPEQALWLPSVGRSQPGASGDATLVAQIIGD
jgi:hypothetical protein